MSRHAAPARKRARVLTIAAAAAVVLLTLTAAAVATTAGGQIGCDPGVSIELKPDGTWRCMAPDSPTPTPSATQTPSPSPSPTVQPSPSDSPTATTPPATTPPAPSPTTSGPQVNCLAAPARCGFPDALSTGPTSGLTVSTRTNYSTANETIVNTEIRGCVEIRAANVTFRNVLFNGPGCFFPVRLWSGSVTIEDAEMTCGNQSGSSGFVNTGSGTAVLRRVEIHNCENGLSVPGNTQVYDSWIHVNMGLPAHTDGAQFDQGASNIVFSHNVIDSRGDTTSAIIMWTESNPQNSNVLITGNLMAGGAYTIYCPRQGPVTNVRITNNRFGPFSFGSSNECTGDHVTEWSGNVVDATGAVLKAA